MDFLFTLVYWKPNVILFGKVDGYHGDWIRCVSNALILSLYTEQGFSRPGLIREVFLDGHEYVRSPMHEKVDYYLLFSSHLKSILKEWLPETKLVVTGSPRVYQDAPSYIAKNITGILTIGVALGVDLGTSSNVLDFYEAYGGSSDSFDEYNGMQGYLSYVHLEKIWLMYLIKHLSKKYKIIVRPRYCNQDDLYGVGQENIVYDYSNDATFFLNQADIVISGDSTIGIEALMTGVPVLSIINMINPGFRYDLLLERNYLKPLWQPSDYNELLDLLQKRQENNLSLSPNIEEYLSMVKEHFYGGNDKDLSTDNITNLLLEVDCGGAADFDVDLYIKLMGHSKQSFFLKLLKQLNSKYIYILLMKIISYKIYRYSKKNKNSRTIIE